MRLRELPLPLFGLVDDHVSSLEATVVLVEAAQCALDFDVVSAEDPHLRSDALVQQFCSLATTHREQILHAAF